MSLRFLSLLALPAVALAQTSCASNDLFCQATAAGFKLEAANYVATVSLNPTLVSQAFANIATQVSTDVAAAIVTGHGPAAYSVLQSNLPLVSDTSARQVLSSVVSEALSLQSAACDPNNAFCLATREGFNGAAASYIASVKPSHTGSALASDMAEAQQANLDIRTKAPTSILQQLATATGVAGYSLVAAQASFIADTAFAQHASSVAAVALSLQTASFAQATGAGGSGGSGASNVTMHNAASGAKPVDIGLKAAGCVIAGIVGLAYGL